MAANADIHAQVLLVDDDRGHAETMAEALKKPGHVCTIRHSRAEAEDELRHGAFDVIVTDLQEKELGDLGFIALCDCYDTPHSAFYGTPTAHKPRTYSTPDATANARISAMLQYILCASRFAHHLKVIARSKIGSNIGAQELEDLLINWLNRYVSPDSEGSMELKARLPLREARVEVKPQKGRPGVYTSVIHLRPHYQLDAAAATVRLSAEMSGLSTAGARI
jgi:type VI secretion system protein ImpC